MGQAGKAGPLTPQRPGLGTLGKFLNGSEPRLAHLCNEVVTMKLFNAGDELRRWELCLVQRAL